LGRSDSSFFFPSTRPPPFPLATSFFAGPQGVSLPFFERERIKENPSGVIGRARRWPFFLFQQRQVDAPLPFRRRRIFFFFPPHVPLPPATSIQARTLPGRFFRVVSFCLRHNFPLFLARLSAPPLFEETVLCFPQKQNRKQPMSSLSPAHPAREFSPLASSMPELSAACQSPRKGRSLSQCFSPLCRRYSSIEIIGAYFFFRSGRVIEIARSP